MKKSIYEYVANDIFGKMDIDEITNGLSTLNEPELVLNILNEQQIRDMLKKFNTKYGKFKINYDSLTKIQMINKIIELVNNKKYEIEVSIDCPDKLTADDYHFADFDVSIDLIITKFIKGCKDIDGEDNLVSFNVSGKIDVETTNNGSSFYCSNPSFTCSKTCSNETLIDIINFIEANYDVYDKAINSNKIYEKILREVRGEVPYFIDFIKNKVNGKDEDFEYDYDFDDEYEEDNNDA